MDGKLVNLAEISGLPLTLLTFLILYSPDYHLQSPRSSPHVLWKLQHLNRASLLHPLPRITPALEKSHPTPSHRFFSALYSGGSQSVVSRPAVSPSNGNLQEMKSLASPQTLGIRKSGCWDQQSMF